MGEGPIVRTAVTSEGEVKGGVPLTDTQGLMKRTRDRKACSKAWTQLDRAKYSLRTFKKNLKSQNAIKR